MPTKQFLGEYLPPANLTLKVAHDTPDAPGSYARAIARGTIIVDSLTSAVVDVLVRRDRGQVSGT